MNYFLFQKIRTVNKVKTNYFLYSVASFLTPWLIFGLEVKGLSVLYLCCVIIFLDFKYWLFKFKYLALKINEYTVFFILVYYFMLISKKSDSVFINFFTAILFTLYFYDSLLEYEEKPIVIGFSSACIFTIFQWVEINFIGTSNLLVNNAVFVFGQVKFGIVQAIGGYAPSEFFRGLIRTSGTTIEPAIFSMMLFAYYPIIKKRWATLFLWWVAFILTLSKVSIFLGLIVISWSVLPKKIFKFNYFLPIFIVFYFLLGISAFSFFETPRSFLFFHPSIYTRFLPAFVYSKLDLINKIFGVGKYGVCDLLSPEIMVNSELGSGWLNFSSKRDCILTNASSVGSLLIDYGILGVLLLVYFFYHNAKYFVTKDGHNTTYLIIISLWFLSLSNTYILTFLPFSYIFLAWGLSQIKIQGKIDGIS